MQYPSSIPIEKFAPIIHMVTGELHAAITSHATMNSAHEGYAILKEEVDELWEAIKLNQKRNPDRDEKIEKEAVQVAAMALRFLMDVCYKGKA